MATKELHCWWRITNRFICWSFCVSLLITLSSSQKISPVTKANFKFTETTYNVTISENAVGKKYVQPASKMGIYLSDPTLDVRYKISGGDPDKFFKAEEKRVGDFSFLRIRTRTGSNIALNRERQGNFVLRIKAIAKYINGPQMTALATVNVQVADLNDMRPIFEPESYHVEIGEDTELHKKIVTVSATDADVGINAEVYYSFREETDTFAIHPTSGVVTLTRRVKFVDKDHYDFTILAENRGFGRGSRSSRAKLHVVILQVNFNAPEIRVQHLPSIVEHGAVGTIYAILVVSDKDIGENGLIDRVEIIDGDHDNFFELKHKKGTFEYNIQVAKALDRETTPQGFNLTIRAWDGGRPPKFTIRDVYVKLSDTNDHAPAFSQTYNVSVNEIVPINTPLLFVNATDTDVGKNAEISYSIMAGPGHELFTIDPFTGLISTAGKLDKETLPQIVLNVRAEDRGNSATRKGDVTTVKVTVLDCNDNAPVFNHTEKSVSVAENTPAGTDVYQVSAYDLDWGENGYVSYSIANTEEVPFKIEHFTGKITITKMLDYESMRRIYKLRIRASDWGSPFRRESETILKVRVKDINDNKPQFEKVEFWFQVFVFIFMA